MTNCSKCGSIMTEPFDEAFDEEGKMAVRRVRRCTRQGCGREELVRA